MGSYTGPSPVKREQDWDVQHATVQPYGYVEDLAVNHDSRTDLDIDL